MVTQQSTQPAADTTLEREVAAMIVAALNLEITAGDIDPEAPLYGEGLGIDSIDILEIALVVSKRFGVHLKADGEDNFRIFSSLRSLADYIATHRTT
ncbi:MAG: phosphopantetheine-binding protein [Betaproteobacteria bacterium]|nr:phosphopantetheine-binding protein [Betaproteobacteria bacterium]